jgi:hypothetical protein
MAVLNLRFCRQQADENHRARLIPVVSTHQAAVQAAKDALAAYPDNFAAFTRALAAADAAKSAATIASETQRRSDLSALDRAVASLGPVAGGNNLAAYFVGMAVREGCSADVAAAAVDS